MCTVPFKTLAAAGTIYESENNDVRTAADRTYDDYDNFGMISHASDVDWWVFTANYTGFANFWLGSIPSGCDYDLYVYSADGTYIACSAKPSGTQEIVRCRVVSGYTYYAKVVTKGGYSGSQYKMRIKNNPIGYVREFLYNGIDNQDSTGINASMSSLWGMGYSGQYYYNNTAGPVYDTFPTSRIFFIANHANSIEIRCGDGNGNNTYLHSAINTNMTSADRSIGSYDSGALSEVRLAVFMGCETGASNPSGYKNLVDAALSKGASCALGWTVIIHNPTVITWTNAFFDSCVNKQMNVENAATAADDKARKAHPDYYDFMTKRYWGSSITSSIAF